jgi:hypothetical protein
MKPRKRKKPDRLGVLVGELCIVQYDIRRLISDAEINLRRLEAMERHVNRLREENRERV